ncbi:MAG TPA: hypothetical protein VHB54_15585 [Mucilaginibacter sp.]|nr:hypothetical protein [Mucilaginibacter sp.]
MKRLLAIDQDVPTLNIINFSAPDLGLEVFSAVHELSLWEVEVLAPDIVLIDCHLNCIDESDLCAQLKLNIQTQSIRVVLLSNAHDYGLAAKNTHADACLLKPLDGKSLIRTLRQFVN